MSPQQLIQEIKANPDNIEFDDVIATINEHYSYTPTRFSNGTLINEAGTNEGSCRIFAFAKLNTLSKAETLTCFGRYYRNDVLNNPDGNDHGNIRNFMNLGWNGIQFDGAALQLK